MPSFSREKKIQLSHTSYSATQVLNQYYSKKKNKPNQKNLKPLSVKHLQCKMTMKS